MKRHFQGTGSAASSKKSAKLHVDPENEHRIPRDNGEDSGQGLVFPDGVWAIVLSYCDSPTLAAVDLTCKQLLRASSPCWEYCALKRFGMFGVANETTPSINVNSAVSSPGKKRWRTSCALVRPHSAVAIPLSRPHLHMSMSASKPLAVSQATGEVVMGIYHPRAPGLTSPIVVRKALDWKRTVELIDQSLEICSNVAFCGAGDSELLVHAHARQSERGILSEKLHAQRRSPRADDGPNSVTLDFSVIDRKWNLPEEHAESDVFDMIGNTNFLIVARVRRFFVFVPDMEHVLKLVAVSRTDDSHGAYDELAWVSPELGTGMFCAGTPQCRICIWQAQARRDNSSSDHDYVKMKILIDIEAEGDVEGGFAASSSYVAVSLYNAAHQQRQIYVYSHSGSLLHTFLAGDSHEDMPIDLAINRGLVATGEILVGMVGATLHVWDMRRGLLLYRLSDFLDCNKTPPPFLLDRNSYGIFFNMVPLYNQSAFCFTCRHGGQYVWAFAHDDEQQGQLQLTRQKNIDTQNELNGADDEEEDADPDGDGDL